MLAGPHPRSLSRGDFAPRSGRRRCCYCTAALVLALAGLAVPPAAAQTEPVPGEATFTIFVRGTDVGREQVNLARSGSQWIITSTGRLGDFTLNRFELKYAADWQPIELHVEGTQAGKAGGEGRPEEVAARDLVRPHERHQRDHAERRDQFEDRSDLRAHDRPAEQRLRRLRGAGGAARERGPRRGVSDLRGRERRGQGHGQGDLRRGGEDAVGHRQDAQIRAHRAQRRRDRSR